MYLGVNIAFNTVGHVTMGSFMGRRNQCIQLVKVLYCKLPTSGKQLPAFSLWAWVWTTDLRDGGDLKIRFKLSHAWYSLKLLNYLFDVICVTNEVLTISIVTMCYDFKWRNAIRKCGSSSINQSVVQVLNLRINGF